MNAAQKVVARQVITADPGEIEASYDIVVMSGQPPKKGLTFCSEVLIVKKTCRLFVSGCEGPGCRQV